MTKQLTVRLSDETYEALVQMAQRQDRAPAVLVRRFVDFAVAHITGAGSPQAQAVATAEEQIKASRTSGGSVVPVTDYGTVTLSTPAPKPPASAPSATHLPCGHSKVLLRGGLCRGCNPMVPG